MPARPHRRKPLKKHLLLSKDCPIHHHHRIFTRRRLEYCDCGNLAITVLQMTVGTDPQYIIRMPLCPACLKLEQELE
jgi:hypothetical protein